MPKLNVQIIPVTPFQQNCALFWDEETKRASIIDPGGEVAKILEAVAKAGAEPAAIFITHGHLDHAGGAAELAAMLQIPIFGPDRRDEMLIADLPNQGARFGMEPKAFTPEKWLSEGETVDISVGRTDFPYGDHQALITSITEKLLPLGDDFGFICGHGMGSSFGAERRSNPFLQ
jgi:hydroxyacylglutathione hydrolase